MIVLLCEVVMLQMNPACGHDVSDGDRRKCEVFGYTVLRCPRDCPHFESWLGVKRDTEMPLQRPTRGLKSILNG